MATIIRNPRFIIDDKTNSAGQAWIVPTDSTSKRNELLNNHWGIGGKRKLFIRSAEEIKDLLSKSIDQGMIMLKVVNPLKHPLLTIEWLPCHIAAATADKTPNAEYYIIEDTYLTQKNAATVPGGILCNSNHDGFGATIGIDKKSNQHYLIINAIKFENINSVGFEGDPDGVGVRVPPPKE